MLNKVDILILAELNKKQKYSAINSIPVYSLDTAKYININTLYKKVCRLEKLNFIEQGIRDCRKNTYFITDLGIEQLKIYK